MVVRICNPSAQEAEAGGFGVQGQPELQGNIIWKAYFCKPSAKQELQAVNMES